LLTPLFASNQALTSLLIYDIDVPLDSVHADQWTHEASGGAVRGYEGTLTLTALMHRRGSSCLEVSMSTV
jgi:hypothetical protein